MWIFQPQKPCLFTEEQRTDTPPGRKTHHYFPWCAETKKGPVEMLPWWEPSSCRGLRVTSLGAGLSTEDTCMINTYALCVCWKQSKMLMNFALAPSFPASPLLGTLWVTVPDPSPRPAADSFPEWVAHPKQRFPLGKYSQWPRSQIFSWLPIFVK